MRRDGTKIRQNLPSQADGTRLLRVGRRTTHMRHERTRVLCVRIPRQRLRDLDRTSGGGRDFAIGRTLSGVRLA